MPATPVVLPVHTPRTPEEIQTALAAAFSQPIKLPSLSPFYQVTLLWLTGCVLVLPVLYVMLPAALVAAGLGWIYLLKDAVHGPRTLMGAMVPALGLWAAALTMLAPVFRRKPQVYVPAPVLPRSEEPFVHAWVEQTARAIGAPMPDQVELIGDANACVAFYKDYRVLRLGTPLLAVCTLAEATGVLAHELGHLRQGWARRALMSCMGVDRWFAEALASTEGDMLSDDPGAIDVVWAVTMWFSGLAMGLFRRVAGFTCWLMARQMELDADRYEVSVAGPQAFTAVMDKLGPTALTVHDTLRRAAEGRAPCPDNMARFAARQVRTLGHGEKKKLARSLDQDAAGVPHPPYHARIAAARRHGMPGVLHMGDQPASSLFVDFDRWARLLTQHQIRNLLPPGVAVVPQENMPRPPSDGG